MPLDLSSIEDVPPAEIVRTGLLPFDLVMGGGFPMGSKVGVYAVDGVGKSTLAMSICDALCLQGRTCVWVDVELAFQDSTKSVMTERLLEHQRNGLFHLKRLLTWNKLDKLMGLVISQLSAGGILPGIIVVDSVSHLGFESRIARAGKGADMSRGSIEDFEQLGQDSRLQGKFLSTWKHSLYTQGIGALFVLQARANFDTMSREKVKAACGFAFRHGVDTLLYMAKSNAVKESAEDRLLNVKGPQKVGTLVTLETKKSRFGMRKIEFPIIYGEGVSNTRFLLDILTRHKIVVPAGGYFRYIGEDGTKHSLRKAEMLDFLESNSEGLYARLVAEGAVPGEGSDVETVAESAAAAETAVGAAESAVGEQGAELKELDPPKKVEIVAAADPGEGGDAGAG